MRGNKLRQQTLKDLVARESRGQEETAAKAQANVVILDDDDDEEDDLPRAAPSGSARHKRVAALVVDDDEEDDDDDDLPITPYKRRRLARKLQSSPVREPGQQVDTQTPPPSSLQTPRKSMRASRKRTEKQKQMELLRRRKRGEKVDEDELEPVSEEDQAAEFDTDDEFQKLDEFDDESEAEEQPPPSSSAARGKNKRKAKTKAKAKASAEEKADGEDDLGDFVVSDEDGDLGAPAELLRQEMPLHFTVNAHKKLIEHFKDGLDWLVQRRINPAFDREDAVYQNAWRKLNDEVRGLANSKFISSGWKVEFQRAIRARPYIECQKIVNDDPLRLEPCQACGRRNHPSTWRILLSGRAYDKDSMEDVESDSEDSEDGSQKKQYDENDNELEPETREWNVGVVCNGNAETAHSLIHVGAVSPGSRSTY